MKRRHGPQSDVLIRLFDREWQRWEFVDGASRRLDAETGENGSRRVLAVPARQVLASPLWIEGSDPVLAAEAAKLELEVRGLLSRAQGMDGVSLRLLHEESRTLAVAVVFPPELPDTCPPAEKYDGSPFMLTLPRDAVTLWRESDDYVAAFTRGASVVYWETIDHTVGTEELRTWLNLIVLRLQGEGVLAAPPRVVSWLEGVPAERIAPAGCAPLEEMADDAAAGKPSLERLQGDWKPVSAHLAEARERQRGRVRQIILAVVAGYIVLAAILGLYAGVLRWKASKLRQVNADLQAEVGKFQPIMRDWSLIATTAEPSHYPLELLSGAVMAMPEGVRLTKFDVESEKITVDGEAPNFAMAKSFYNSLTISERLHGIDWTETNPTVEAVVTKFHNEGILPPLLPPQ